MNGFKRRAAKWFRWFLEFGLVSFLSMCVVLGTGALAQSKTRTLRATELTGSVLCIERDATGPLFRAEVRFGDEVERGEGRITKPARVNDANALLDAAERQVMRGAGFVLPDGGVDAAAL